MGVAGTSVNRAISYNSTHNPSPSSYLLPLMFCSFKQLASFLCKRAICKCSAAELGFMLGMGCGDKVLPSSAASSWQTGLPAIEGGFQTCTEHCPKSFVGAVCVNTIVQVGFLQTFSATLAASPPSVICLKNVSVSIREYSTTITGKFTVS